MPSFATSAGHLVHELRRARMQFARFLVREQRQRHAPHALARDAPVGTAGDHAVDALLAPARCPLDLADLGERRGAQACLFHADEPLRRRAEDHRRLVAPAVRIAVAERLVMQQRAAFARAPRRRACSRRRLSRRRRSAWSAGSARRCRRGCRPRGRTSCRRRSLPGRDPARCARRRCRCRASRDHRGSRARHDRRTDDAACRCSSASPLTRASSRDARQASHASAPTARAPRDDQHAPAPAPASTAQQRVFELSVNRDSLVGRQRPRRGRPDHDAGAARRQA